MDNSACFNKSGASVVDYVLAEISIYKNITQFKVLPPEYDSKHAPIIIIVKARRLQKSANEIIKRQLYLGHL